MASKKTNGSSNGHVEVDREEYAALVALKDLYDGVVVENAKTVNRNNDLLTTCRAQAKRLTEIDLIMQNYERINDLQRRFIDLLRADQPKVASLEDLSEFWRQWRICTEDLVKRNPQQSGEVSKIEPDLFKTWKNWSKDSGRTSRSLSLAGARSEGTRAEVAAQQPSSQEELQERAIKQLRDASAAMATRLQELESEVNAYKNSRKSKSIS